MDAHKPEEHKPTKTWQIVLVALLFWPLAVLERILEKIIGKD